MLNKRGQFFLIAALVIIGIIAGLSGIYSEAKVSEEDTTVYDLAKEINYEAGQVIDTGIFVDSSQEEISQKIDNLTDFYALENPGSTLLVVYGNQTSLTLKLYNNTGTGSISLDDSGALGWSFQEGREYITTYNPTGDTINITFDGITYFFDLKPGQMFFVILKKVKQEDIFVAVQESPTQLEI